MGIISDDNVDVFMGHIMLYQDSKFHKTDPIKARVIAKKYLAHLENHPDATLYEYLDRELSNSF
jgi:hypothetical protein